MNMEPQVACREAAAVPENVLIKDVITSKTHHVASNQPVKKRTRQWGAWTHQEEESFFNALHQFGKDFDKITSCVQSKNKDQVRRYYYRLVLRMNKLLGPELSLDSKNSKDTNAAMLRCCKALKLHLKPRRLKIFLETLRQQLLEDLKKTKKKRPFQGENRSLTPLTPPNGDSTQNSKGDMPPVKQARQKTISGGASAAAYKTWEKAAIVGVSLVADSAAHSQQAALDTLLDSLPSVHGDDAVASDIPRVPCFNQTLFPTNTIQPLSKLKLQLFPFSESIRRALEMDNHNPHLELTLSCRKKISSVLEHINRKWGSCSVASGELMLLPYHARSSDPMSSLKWTQDSASSASDVYAAVGSPSVFCLRYGWFVKPPQEPLPIAATRVSQSRLYAEPQPIAATQVSHSRLHEEPQPVAATHVSWSRLHAEPQPMTATHLSQGRLCAEPQQVAATHVFQGRLQTEPQQIAATHVSQSRLHAKPQPIGATHVRLHTEPQPVAATHVSQVILHGEPLPIAATHVSQSRLHAEHQTIAATHVSQGRFHTEPQAVTHVSQSRLHAEPQPIAATHVRLHAESQPIVATHVLRRILHGEPQPHISKSRLQAEYQPIAATHVSQSRLHVEPQPIAATHVSQRILHGEPQPIAATHVSQSRLHAEHQPIVATHVSQNGVHAEPQPIDANHVSQSRLNAGILKSVSFRIISNPSPTQFII